MPKYSFILMVVALVFSACSSGSSSPDENPVTIPKDNEKEGMVLIQHSTESVEIAENMNAVLTYDYFIGMHEVTCGEFGDRSCSNDSLPVTNVTFYDAVLFANAKSKSEKLDTVYSYSDAKFDSEKHCTYLEKLSVDLNCEGYRLPTEAEWIKAASLNWNAKNSWNSGNAENKSHKVCSKQTDDSEFCDFEGNVMEWVNDWLGSVVDSTFENFIGGEQPNGIGERIVKGGSFVNDVQSISLFSRSDVYTVTSSTRTEYIGFRLALGKIPDAQSVIVSSRLGMQKMTPLATSEIVRDIAGTSVAKLAFRNDISGNLVFINYSDVTLSVIEIQDTLKVFHPEISPNGSWVAFCTGMEGIDVNSRLFVRKLDPTGSKLIRLDVANAAIPRWSVAANGDTVITYVTNAKSNKNTEDWRKTSTWQVPFSNGSFGTPKKLFDGSYHGGISEDASLAVSGARLLRARKAKTQSTIYDSGAVDTIWYNGEQACNASLVQDGTQRTAFLDFAGKTGKDFVGKSYATHQRIFIADKNGKLIQSIAAPAGYTFDHTEWATDGKISNIVATLTDGNGAHEKIVLVNVNDSSVTELVKGEEIWHPCLWVKRAGLSKVDVVLDPDSAGVYFTAGGSEIAVKWRYKMELFWNYRDSINAAVLGSSRALHGVIPEQLKNVKAVNFANSNCNLYCTKFFLDNYVLPHVKKLKYIILSLDIDMSFATLASSFFEGARTSIPGYIYDENHKFWKDGVPKNLYQLTYESMGYYKFDVFRETLGFEALDSEGWGEPKIWTDSMWVAKRRDLYDATFALLKDFIAEAYERDIKVLGVIFPQHPLYANTGSFSFHGIQRSLAPTLIQEIEDLSKTYPNFILMDENKMGNHDYTDEMAFDCNHLSAVGAVQMTHRIDSVLATLPK